MKEQGKAQVAKKEQWKRKLLETAVSRAQDFGTYRRRKSLRNDPGKSNA